MANDRYPTSPCTEIDGLPYFPRLCEKVRLFAAGDLHSELHGNLGHGMDLWICQFLGVEYEALRKEILNGASDEQALHFATTTGTKRPDYERAWFVAYLKTRGFRDDFSEKLALRRKESGFENRPEILTFFDYIDADEGRL